MRYGPSVNQGAPVRSSVQRAPGLRERLRRATQPAHRRLEAALALLDEPVSPTRILGILQRFYGFHAVWEPALESAVPATFLLPRRKLALLEQDLRILGMTDAWLRNAPSCRAARDLCGSEAAAAGSLYVMEGGTLGGQVITRALEHTVGFPGRLNYWNPYGADTSRRWTETVSYLEALPASCADEAVASAVRCFKVLNSWLLEGQCETFG